MLSPSPLFDSPAAGAAAPPEPNSALGYRIWQGSIGFEKMEMMIRFLHECPLLMHGTVYGFALIQNVTDCLEQFFLCNVPKQMANPFGFYVPEHGADFSQIGMHVLVMFERPFRPPRESNPKCFFISDQTLKAALECLTDSTVSCCAVVCVCPQGVHVFRMYPSQVSKTKVINRYCSGGNEQFSRQVVSSLGQRLEDEFLKTETQNQSFFHNFFKPYHIRFDFIPTLKAKKQGIQLKIICKSFQGNSVSNPKPQHAAFGSLVANQDNSTSNLSFSSPSFPSNREEDEWSFCSMEEGLFPPGMEENTSSKTNLEYFQQHPQQVNLQEPPQQQYRPFSSSAIVPCQQQFLPVPQTMPVQKGQTHTRYENNTLPNTGGIGLTDSDFGNTHSIPLPKFSSPIPPPVALPAMQELELYGPRRLPDGQVLFVVDQVVQSLCPAPFFTLPQQSLLVEVYMTLAEIFSQQPTQNTAIQQYRRYTSVLQDQEEYNEP